MVAPSVVYVAALLFDPGRSLVLWNRLGVEDGVRVLPLAVVLLAYAAMAIVILRGMPDRPSLLARAGLLGFVVVAGLALQLAATGVLEPYPLRGTLIRQYSDFTGGYFSVGARAGDLIDFLSGYAERMAGFPVHPQRHPPGLALVFWAANGLGQAFPWLASALAPTLRPLACFDPGVAALSDAQLLSGLAGAGLETALTWLIPVALYGWLRARSSERAGALAALLFPLMPGALMWASQWDRTFGLFAVLALWGCDLLADARGLSTPTAIAVGVTLGVATVASFGNLPLVLLCAIYAVLQVFRRDRFAGLGRRVAQAACVTVGFAGVWATLAALGFDALAAYNTSMRFHLSLERPYWPFVFWHFWDIATFIGVPAVFLTLVIGFKRAPAATIACFLTVAILCVAHVARGETGRVWMFFAPVVAAAAATSITLEEARDTVSTKRLSLVLAAMMAVTGIAHIGLLDVIGYGRDPLSVSDAVPPPPMSPIRAEYGERGEVALFGYVAPARLAPGESSRLDLYWRQASGEPIPVSWKVFVHLSDSIRDEVRIVNQDSIPMNWLLPMTCWRPGQIVQDTHTFTVDANARPGNYVFLVGLYDPVTSKRSVVHVAEVGMGGAVQLPLTVTVGP